MIQFVANRAECRAARRFKDLTDLQHLSARFSDRVLHSGVPAQTRSLLMQPRFRARLERRALRRFGALSNPSAAMDSDISYLVSVDDTELERIFADVGAYCHYAALRRIVDPSDVRIVSLELGIDLTHHEARGLSESSSMEIAYQLPVVSGRQELSEMASTILRDGALCFALWLERRPLVAQRLMQAQLNQKFGQITLVPGKRLKCEAERRAALFGARLAVLQEDLNDLQESA